MRETTDFKPNDTVVYVPQHRQSEMMHDDCVPGVVTSINNKFVFVRFWKDEILMETSNAVDPNDLWFRK